MTKHFLERITCFAVDNGIDCKLGKLYQHITLLNLFEEKLKSCTFKSHIINKKKMEKIQNVTAIE